MKQTMVLSVMILTAFLAVQTVAAQQQWGSIYYYTDDEYPAYVMNFPNDLIEVRRTYAWQDADTFSNMYSARVQIKTFDADLYESDAAREWTSPRLAITNPDNDLERYELRFLPEKNRLQVNYVDRTGRTGDWEIDQMYTVSEVLASTTCKINVDEWYYAVIAKNGAGISQSDGRWRAIVMSAKYPTCIVEWDDTNIQSDEYLVGVQSAGKYMVSRFQRVIGI